MIKTPLSTVIGGAFWTPSATILGGTSKTFDQIVKSIFANNEQGFFYDPNDLSTMFQDSAGTVPVTGVGQPVGRVLDKSGRNNHAYQTTSASRPILRKNAITGAYYLEFDGADDSLQTSNINFTATDEVSLFAGVRKLSDAAAAVVFELSVSWLDNAGSFVMHTPYTHGGSNFYSGARGTATAAIALASTITGSEYAAPVSTVVSAKHDISGDYSMMIVNGVNGGVATADKGTGNYGNYPLYIGRRAGTSLPFNGHIYSLIGVGKLASDSETAAIEKELAKRTGVTLNV